MAQQGNQSSVGSMASWFGDDMKQIDAVQANHQFHTSPPVLQSNEVCEMAFQGRRDLVLFTTKRILFIDKQGWSGKKMAFTSFPYKSIKVFQVSMCLNVLYVQLLYLLKRFIYMKNQYYR